MRAQRNTEEVKVPTLSRKIAEIRVGHPLGLIDFEVEDVGDLEIGPIVEDQVASDDYVDVVRGRRGKHDFELPRTGLHSAAKAGRKSAPDDELTL